MSLDDDISKIVADLEKLEKDFIRVKEEIDNIQQAISHLLATVLSNTSMLHVINNELEEKLKQYNWNAENISLKAQMSLFQEIADFQKEFKI